MLFFLTLIILADFTDFDFIAKINKSFYWSTKQSYSWSDAKSECENLNGSLAAWRNQNMYRYS